MRRLAWGLPWVGAAQKVPTKALLGTLTTQSDRVCRSCERTQDWGGPGLRGGLHPHVETVPHTQTHTFQAPLTRDTSATHTHVPDTHTVQAMNTETRPKPWRTPAPRSVPTDNTQDLHVLMCSRTETHSPGDTAHTHTYKRTRRSQADQTHVCATCTRGPAPALLSPPLPLPPHAHTHVHTHMCTCMSPERLWSEPRIDRPPSGALLPG